MFPGLDLCSTYTDPAEHPMTAAVGSTVGPAQHPLTVAVVYIVDYLDYIDYLCDLDRDLSEV